MRRWTEWMLWSVAAIIVIVGVWRLETERSSVSALPIETAAGPVTLYSAEATSNGPLVFVTHGFAGSQQMMQYISRDLARGGFTVAAFDFFGHGQSRDRMSADVTRIEGTTQQLVRQTRDAIDAVRSETGVVGPVALVGHSMATDIIIRAAEVLPDVAAIVAISMYSDAITPTFPERLLVLSGAWEGRLRAVGLEAVVQVKDGAVEGQTVMQGDITRRAVSVPWTEHVAVLFAPATQKEARTWLQDAFDMPVTGEASRLGPTIVAVLAALVVLIWPLTCLLPRTSVCHDPLRPIPALAAIILPAVPAIAVTLYWGGGVLGTAAFGGLVAFFAVWGAGALFILWWSGRRMGRPNAARVALLLLWGLAVFALALDRYGAAFVPFGPRLWLMCALLIGTIPFMLADRLLMVSASLWQRVIARIVPVTALAFCMFANPETMGLLFTVLPVMVLFYVVYGTMARAVSGRVGPEAAGLGQGIILAWAIAASTPLFAG